MVPSPLSHRHFTDMGQDPMRVASGLKATINNPNIAQDTKDKVSLNTHHLNLKLTRFNTRLKRSLTTCDRA